MEENKPAQNEASVSSRHDFITRFLQLDKHQCYHLEYVKNPMDVFVYWALVEKSDYPYCQVQEYENLSENARLKLPRISEGIRDLRILDPSRSIKVKEVKLFEEITGEDGKRKYVELATAVPDAQLNFSFAKEGITWFLDKKLSLEVIFEQSKCTAEYITIAFKRVYLADKMRDEFLRLKTSFPQ